MRISCILLSSLICALGEYVVRLPSGREIGLATKGHSAFRVRITSKSPENPMVRPSCSEKGVTVDQQCMSDASYTVIDDAGSTGISTNFGRVMLDSAGCMLLYDKNGKLLTKSQPLSHLDDSDAGGLGVPSIDQKNGQLIDKSTVVDELECHRNCVKTSGCEVWVTDAETWRNKRQCWLFKNVEAFQFAFDDRITGALHQTLHFSTKGERARLYGGGSGMSDAQQLDLSAGTAAVINEASYAPYYYSATDGYGALGVVTQSGLNRIPVAYGTRWGRISWAWLGDFELFLMPAENLEKGIMAYYDLIGRPPVPPLYAFGFIASRYGWKNTNYMNDVLSKFRSKNFPIDACITDFEWFTNVTDYDFPAEGKQYYRDFGWNPDLFPSPKEQLFDFHNNMHLKFAGIRKPRMGRSETLNFLRSKGWLIGGPGEGGEPEGYAKGRGVNFTIPEVRDWYREQMVHYLDEGVDFWWNDEGEDSYYNFYWWNLAQLEILRSRNATKRFFSINRAFSPGSSRFGAGFWTGDVHATWTDLWKTPGMVLNWNLAGAPYTGCDTGGFIGQTTAHLLSRWYQVAAFLPIMRIHSTNYVKPHWPWLYGKKAAVAMREALDLRYRLIPYHYSFAKVLYWTGKIYMRPMVMDFPDDPLVADMTSQYMFGELLVAPVTNPHSMASIYLPEGRWFTFNTSKVTDGPREISYKASLRDIPVYVKVGTIVVMGPVVQHTGQLPNGALSVQVYTGKNASFDLYEDDGATINFTEERKVSFKWDETNFKLAWSAVGKTFPHSFRKIKVSLFQPGIPMFDTGPYDIGASDTLQFSKAYTNEVESHIGTTHFEVFMMAIALLLGGMIMALVIPKISRRCKSRLESVSEPLLVN